MYDLVESVSDLIRIPSVSGDRENCLEALYYMLQRGDEFGFSVSLAADGRIGIIEYGQGSEALGILTHVDVAHPGDYTLWESPPFQPVVDADRIYGRGAVDDKGPAMAALFAMADVAELSRRYGLPARKKVRMIIGTEQKAGGGDMRDYLLTHRPPDYSFSPDGMFPLCNVEMGSFNVLISFPLETEGQVLRDVRAGSNPETVPEVCKVTLNDGRTFAARGSAGHISMLALTDNAIFNMAEALESLRGRNKAKIRRDTTYRIFRKLKAGFFEGNGRRAGLPGSLGRYKNEYSGENVYAPTAIFRQKDRLFVNINARLSPDTREDQVLTAIERYFREDIVRIDRISSQPASFISRNQPFIKAMAEAYEHLAERPAEFHVDSVGTYAQIVPNSIVFGPTFGDEDNLRHHVNESMSLQHLKYLETLYERVISNIIFLKRSFR